MFTGLVWGTGAVQAIEARGGDVRLVVGSGSCLAARTHALGDSITVNGVCLTLVSMDGQGGFGFDVSTETLGLTTLGGLAPGDLVNLEPALTLSTPLGGHLLSGHVDGVAQVRSIEPDGRAQRWHFQVPTALLRYLARKGSVAVDGVSLTINEVDQQGFAVALIPHTVAVTRFRALAVGDRVNLEVDQLARYLERLLAFR
jgi:riboflavin synthase